MNNEQEEILEEKIVEEIKEIIPDMDYCDIWLSYKNPVQLEGHYKTSQLREIIKILEKYGV